MTAWVKENGTEIELNDEEATVKFAESKGWKRKSKKAKKEKVDNGES